MTSTDNRLTRSLQYGLSSNDPRVLAGSAVALELVALCAGIAPVHRGFQVNPMHALCCEWLIEFQSLHSSWR